LATVLGAAFVIAGGAGYLSVIAARMAAPQWAEDTNRVAVIVIAVVYLAVGAVILAGLGRTRAERTTRLGISPIRASDLGYGIAVWSGAYLAAGAFYAISGPLGGPTLHDAANLLMSVGADNGRLSTATVPVAAVILLRIVALSPIVEELLFRGALFTWMRMHLAAKWTILATALLFGAIHQSPTFLPLAIAVGLASGSIRERTGSVVPVVVVHALQSAAIVVLSLIVTGWDAPPIFG
jgi:membrane protease YdiL (CAAX protease family)